MGVGIQTKRSGRSRIVVLAAIVSLFAAWLIQGLCRSGAIGASPATGTASSAASTTSSAPAFAPGTTQKITILHVADVHGKLESWAEGSNNCGGYARLSTAVADIRNDKAAGEVLLLDAGDDFSRGDKLTEKTQGAAPIALMNYLKFNAWTPGNGDFYAGQGTLQKRIGEFKGDTLAANIKVRSSGQPLAKDFVIYQAGKVKVAVVGLCFVRTALPSAWGLEVADPIDTLSKMMPNLRKQANVVLVLSHLGHEQDRKIIETIDGVDMILGGHSHVEYLTGKKFKSPSGREILVCHTGQHLKFFGQAELNLRYDGSKWVVDSSNEKLVRLNQNVRMDPAVTALIAKMSQVAESQPADIGQVEQESAK